MHTLRRIITVKFLCQAFRVDSPGGSDPDFVQAFDLKGEVGRLIDIATSDTLIGPDWEMNQQICDKIELNPKEG